MNQKNLNYEIETTFEITFMATLKRAKELCTMNQKNLNYEIETRLLN